MRWCVSNWTKLYQGPIRFRLEYLYPKEMEHTQALLSKHGAKNSSLKLKKK